MKDTKTFSDVLPFNCHVLSKYQNRSIIIVFDQSCCSEYFTLISTLCQEMVFSTFNSCPSTSRTNRSSFGRRPAESCATGNTAHWLSDPKILHRISSKWPRASSILKKNKWGKREFRFEQTKILRIRIPECRLAHTETGHDLWFVVVNFRNVMGSAAISIPVQFK